MRRAPSPRGAIVLVSLLACLMIPGIALGQGERRPVTSERVDAVGMEWFYEERADEIDDRWQVLVFGTIRSGLDRGASIGLLCVEDLGRKMRIDVPRWTFGDGVRRSLQARVDRGEAFEVSAIGESHEINMAYLEFSRGGQRVMDGFATARERIVIRDPQGRTVVFPMDPERPEVSRAIARCRELLRGG